MVKKENYVVQRWDGVRGARLMSDYSKNLRDIDDTTFDVVLEMNDGTEVVLAITGGNGGAYGACVDIERQAARR